MKEPMTNLFERKKSLVSFSNSILKHYGATTFHESDEEVDKVLAGHRRICVFLFDGAGEYNLNLYKKTNRYILAHSFARIYSTNPSTTVAATTSFLTGKWPMETGWIGWSIWMKDLGYPVDVFLNRNSLDGSPAPQEEGGLTYMEKLCPTEKLDSLLTKAGVKAKLSFFHPIGGPSSPKTIKEMGQQASSFFREGGEFLYSYCNMPDGHMHSYGVRHWRIKRDYRQMNKMVKRFVKENPDVLVLTMADHGLINISYRDISAYKELTSLLDKPLSIEGRNAAFFVKKGKEREFKHLFELLFPSFLLFSREEIISKGLFGEGEEEPHFKDFIGDFQAISMGRDVLVQSDCRKSICVLKAHHAGGTEEERAINLSVWNN